MSAADVAVEFAHKGLAEAHHFAVGFAFGVEVRTAFAAAHRQRGERVFEDLFEGQEFEHAQIDGRMEAQAAFVGADGGTHLHAVAPVYLNPPLVVHPRHAEHNHALGFDDAFQQAVAGVARVFVQKRFQAAEHFFHRLMENALIRVALLDGLEQGVDVAHGFFLCEVLQTDCRRSLAIIVYNLQPFFLSETCLQGRLK